MAFDVTPTSGAGPYTATAIINDAYLIDGVNYYAELRTSISEGVCPTQGQASPVDQAIVNQLIMDGSAVLTNLVADGSCRAYSFRLRRVDDDVVVSSSTAFVDNV